MTVKSFFHAISYLQYPLILIGVYFVISPYLNGLDHLGENSHLIFEGINNALVFMGLGISFSTFQDPTKTQNNFSKRIWEDPVKGKRTLFLMAIMASALIIWGLIGFLKTEKGILHEISFGLMVLGIGYLGLLQVAIDMFENHRKDMNP